MHQHNIHGCHIPPADAQFLPADSPAAQQAEQLRREFLSALAEQKGSGSALAVWVAEQQAEGFSGLPPLRVYSCRDSKTNAFLVPGGYAVRCSDQAGQSDFEKAVYCSVRVMLADKGLLLYRRFFDTTFEGPLRELDAYDAQARRTIWMSLVRSRATESWSWNFVSVMCAFLSLQVAAPLTLLYLYGARECYVILNTPYGTFDRRCDSGRA